jgi:hypothetical protein
MGELRVGRLPPKYRMSPEVWTHSMRQHRCQGAYVVSVCPCRHTELLSCGECDEGLVLFLASNRPICEHAEPYLAATR